MIFPSELIDYQREIPEPVCNTSSHVIGQGMMFQETPKTRQLIVIALGCWSEHEVRTYF